ncbi:MAG: DUF4105 domain-containing protein [Cocleimonas sp.]|nr:DUF4105 domain-containing protein [Cocleimonas sp.]
MTIKKTLKIIAKWLIAPLTFFGLATALLYYFSEAKQDRNWVVEHRVLSNIQIQGDGNNPSISVKNIRDYQWKSTNKVHYKDMQFQLDNIVELKAVVSHFSIISEIAHVFLIFVLDDGREFAVSVEARREVGEEFSIQGGLLARFELIYVLATPDDLLGIRKINGESTHLYPIKETKEKARELFMLIAAEVNGLNENPEMYHLFFKNCTNQLVKHVSILTEQKYPWYFQTLAPGNTAKMLYKFNLIDMPNMSFEEIQAKTRIK